MTAIEEGRVEISNEAGEMLDSMPQQVAISVMISLAVNLIRAAKGEFKGKLLDDPILLIAEMSAMISLQMVLRNASDKEGEPTDKSKAH